MEQALPGEAAGVPVGVPVEVPEWVDLAGEEWAARERVRVLLENAFVPNAERLSRIEWECPVMIRTVPNAGQKW